MKMKKVNILLIFAVVVSTISLVIVTVADVTDYWGTVEESGEILRVPWKTSTVIGLWTSCTSRESGFVREEVYTYTCYPTKEGEYVLPDQLGVSQAFVIVATVSTASAAITGGLYLLLFPHKIFVLVLATVFSLLSVLSSTISVATFQNSFQIAFQPSWSFYVGAASLGCKVLAAVGYIVTTVKSCKMCIQPNSVENEYVAENGTKSGKDIIQSRETTTATVTTEQ